MGGMGKVYLATGERGLLAVKVVHPGLAHDDTFRSRFRHEIANGRKVGEPWALAVVDADADAPSPWLATAYVPGPSLDRAVAATGPLPEPTVRLLAAALAESLAHIHGVGLVHRDVKPSNVLLGPERPYLIDLGIARAAEGTQLTATGAIIGTPAFMSPEQAEGDEAGAASDVFSLGSVLVFAATGRGPFGEGSSFAIMRRISDDPPDLGGTAEPVRSIAEACLAKRPSDRPSAAEVVGLLAVAPTLTAGWLPARITALVQAPDTDHTVRGANTRHGHTALMPAEPERRPLIGRRALLAGASVAGVVAVAGVATAAVVGRRTSTPQAAPPPVTAPAVPEPTQRWNAAGGPSAGVAVIADGGAVHVGGSNSRPTLATFDAGTGARRWAFDMPQVERSFLLDATNFAVAGGSVCVAADGAIHAVDATTGTTRWTVPLDERHDGLRVGVGAADALYVANRDRLEKRDPASGRVLWAYTGIATAAPTTDGARCFIQDGLSITALAADTGRMIWRHDVEQNLLIRLAAADGLVCGVDDTSGTLMALDAVTGTVRWSATVPQRPSNDPRRLAAVGSGVVCVTSDDNQVHAFSADTGALLWVRPDRAAGEGAVRTSPVIADGLVYAGGDNGRVYAWDAASGSQRWVKPTGMGPITAVGAAGGTVFAASIVGQVMAMGQP
jgi:outer membrane protein assembly factor BamB